MNPDTIVQAREFIRSHGGNPDPMPQDPAAALEQLLEQVLDLAGSCCIQAEATESQ